jgi:methionyl aminopeptidase
MEQKEAEKYRKAGKIAEETVKYAKSIIKKDMLLFDIAEKIEAKIKELGGKPAFPVNLSIDKIAAHYTPAYNDKNKASGLLKVDVGVHVRGHIVDAAFTLDLENSKENKKLIEAAEKALKEATKIIKPKIEVWEIGKFIQDTVASFNFSPIRNLSGHELARYKLHAGLTIPNTNNNNKTKLPEGVYAIEPFTTTGQGLVYEGRPSGIYKLKEKKPIRDSFARKILAFIEQEYRTLPFCSRWLVKEFGTRALISLSFLEKAGILHHFPQLIEKGHSKVAQAETTMLVLEEKIETLTK